MKTKIIITNEQLRNRAVQVCGSVPLDTPHVVEIRPHRKNRSEQQNRYYWAIITIIAADLGLTKDEMHDEYKERFLLPIFVRDDAGYAAMVNAVTAADSGLLRQVVALTSTSQCNVKQFTEYLDEIKGNAFSLGIRLPALEDYE